MWLPFPVAMVLTKMRLRELCGFIAESKANAKSCVTGGTAKLAIAGEFHLVYQESTHSMSNDEFAARQACQGILDSLGDLPFDLSIAATRLDTDAEPDLAFESTSVEITLAIDHETAIALWHIVLPHQEAVINLASQVQDALVESRAAWGVPIPPCGSHGHPLEPRIADGAAIWACPLGAADAVIPIRGATPS